MYNICFWYQCKHVSSSSNDMHPPHMTCILLLMCVRTVPEYLHLLLIPPKLSITSSGLRSSNLQITFLVYMMEENIFLHHINRFLLNIHSYHNVLAYPWYLLREYFWLLVRRRMPYIKALSYHNVLAYPWYLHKNLLFWFHKQNYLYRSLIIVYYRMILSVHGKEEDTYSRTLTKLSVSVIHSGILSPYFGFIIL